MYRTAVLLPLPCVPYSCPSCATMVVEHKVQSCSATACDLMPAGLSPAMVASAEAAAAPHADTLVTKQHTGCCAQTPAPKPQLSTPHTSPQENAQYNSGCAQTPALKPQHSNSSAQTPALKPQRSYPSAQTPEPKPQRLNPRLPHCIGEVRPMSPLVTKFVGQGTHARCFLSPGPYVLRSHVTAPTAPDAASMT